MAPARKAAQKAQSEFKNQDLSSDSDSAEEGTGDVWDQSGSSKPKPQLKNVYGGAKKRGRQRASTASSIPVLPKQSPKSNASLPRKNARKRSLSVSPTRSVSLSAVSSLSSISDFVPERPTISSSVSLPVVPSPLKHSASVRDLLNGVLSHHKKSSVLERRAEGSSESINLPVTAAEPWSLENLGVHVWVRINRTGDVTDGSDDAETYWWPAQILTPPGTAPLEIAFYGTISTATVLKQKCLLDHPSSSNIRSMRSGTGSCRFTSSNFMEVKHDDAPSPRKKTKFDDGLNGRWETAADEMVEADAGAHGGLSTRLLKFSGAGAATPESKPNRRGRKSLSSISVDLATESDGEGIVDLTQSANESDLEDELDPADEIDFEKERLTIPGEVVYCREKRTQKEYWPAKIMAYAGPQTKPRKTKAKYTVLFFDGLEKAVDRDMFYASFQDDFGTCKLGQFTSDQALDINNDADSDQEIEEISRGESPVPKDPPPARATFCKQDLHQQFAYVKPVLVAILNERYNSGDRHKKFMQGGNARKSLTTDAGQKGLMSAQESRQLMRILLWWALRDETKAKPGVEAADIQLQSDPPPPPSSLAPTDTEASDHEMESAPSELTELIPQPRQIGCPAYERLAPHEKLNYCTDVLTYEAVLQILLWRVGKRTSMEVLSDEEEETLHQSGVELMQASDWINHALELRASSEKRLDKEKGKSKGRKGPQVVGGTKTRPRRK